MKNVCMSGSEPLAMIHKPAVDRLIGAAAGRQIN